MRPHTLFNKLSEAIELSQKYFKTFPNIDLVQSLLLHYSECSNVEELHEMDLIPIIEVRSDGESNDHYFGGIENGKIICYNYMLTDDKILKDISDISVGEYNSMFRCIDLAQNLNEMLESQN